MQVAPTTPRSTPVLAERVQAAVDDWRAKHGVPGVAVSIREAGRPLVDAVSGVASLATGRELGADDRMWAGSISKTVTAAVTLALAAEGRLSLDDTLARWHPKMPNADRITVHQLLDHTSGLPDLTNDDGAYREHFRSSPLEPWTRERLLDAIRAHPGAVEPGGAQAYSNANYLLLHDIAERAGGQRFDALVDAYVLQPAGATSSQLDLGEGSNPATVAAHAAAGGATPHVDTTWRLGAGSFLRSTLGGAGALVVTAADLARIGEAILWKQGAVLDPASRARMLGSADRSPSGYGLGVFTLPLYAGQDEPSTVYGHNGHLGETASALLLHVPDSERSIAIMLPSDPPPGDDMPAARLASTLLDLVGGRHAG